MTLPNNLYRDEDYYSSYEIEHNMNRALSDEQEFIPDPLYYHLDVTDNITLLSRSSRFTTYIYNDLGTLFKVQIPNKIIKTKNLRVYFHQRIFSDILLNSPIYEPDLPKDILIEGIQEYLVYQPNGNTYTLSKNNNILRNSIVVNILKVSDVEIVCSVSVVNNFKGLAVSSYLLQEFLMNTRLSTNIFNIKHNISNITLSYVSNLLKNILPQVNLIKLTLGIIVIN